MSRLLTLPDHPTITGFLLRHGLWPISAGKFFLRKWQADTHAPYRWKNDPGGIRTQLYILERDVSYPIRLRDRMFQTESQGQRNSKHMPTPIREPSIILPDYV